MSKVIIAGGRDFNDWNLVLETVIKFYAAGEYIDVVVSGCAKGADALGEKLAVLIEKPVKKFPADWIRYGKGAGHIRNRQMANYADTLIAFWDGKSTGTKNMIDEATELELDVIVVRY